MSILDQLDVNQLKALADKAGLDRDKVLSIATAMLPALKDKWQSLTGGGDTPLFTDLMAGPRFQAMFTSGELDGAVATAARDAGLDAETVHKLLPELGKLVAR